jgi:hypothetical protein
MPEMFAGLGFSLLDDEYSIPYEDLEVRHLGEMYEAILEYKVRLVLVKS